MKMMKGTFIYGDTCITLLCIRLLLQYPRVIKIHLGLKSNNNKKYSPVGGGGGGGGGGLPITTCY